MAGAVILPLIIRLAHTQPGLPPTLATKVCAPHCTGGGERKPCTPLSTGFPFSSADRSQGDNTPSVALPSSEKISIWNAGKMAAYVSQHPALRASYVGLGWIASAGTQAVWSCDAQTTWCQRRAGRRPIRRARGFGQEGSLARRVECADRGLVATELAGALGRPGAGQRVQERSGQGPDNHSPGVPLYPHMRRPPKMRLHNPTGVLTQRLKNTGLKEPRASGAQSAAAINQSINQQNLPLILQVFILPVCWQVRAWVVLEEVRPQSEAPGAFQAPATARSTPLQGPWAGEHVAHICPQPLGGPKKRSWLFKSTTANGVAKKGELLCGSPDTSCFAGWRAGGELPSGRA